MLPVLAELNTGGICSAERSAVLCLDTAYCDINEAPHDHGVGCLTQSACAVSTRFLERGFRRAHLARTYSAREWVHQVISNR